MRAPSEADLTRRPGRLKRGSAPPKRDRRTIRSPTAFRIQTTLFHHLFSMHDP